MPSNTTLAIRRIGLVLGIAIPVLAAVLVFSPAPVVEVAGQKPVRTGFGHRGIINYADAQVSSAGGNLLVVYGVSTTISPWANFFSSLTASFKNCLLGSGVNCNGPMSGFAFVPAAGSGISCPTGYTPVFSGYGPYTYNARQYYYDNSLPIYQGWPPRASNNPVPPPSEQIPVTDVANELFGVTHSICGEDAYTVAQTDYQIYDLSGSNLTGVGEAATVLSACSPTSASAVVCNTCLICQGP